jgi:hypothetical protein
MIRNQLPDKDLRVMKTGLTFERRSRYTAASSLSGGLSAMCSRSTPVAKGLIAAVCGQLQLLLLMCAPVGGQAVPPYEPPQPAMTRDAPTTYPSTATPLPEPLAQLPNDRPAAGANPPATPAYGNANGIASTAPGPLGSYGDAAVTSAVPSGPATQGPYPDFGSLPQRPYGEWKDYMSGGGDGGAPDRSLDADAYVAGSSEEPWRWQLLPSGLMYRSYLAGGREPRFGSQWVHERNLGWLWDATLGGRVGLVRLGNTDPVLPEGWQLDFEGAAFVRMNLDHDRDVDDVDFRAGVPLTTRQGPWEMKFGYYHLSSHLGDEFLARNPGYPRINYVRESLVAGMAVYLGCLRLYSEAGWAFHTDGGAEPWEFQFGADFVPLEPTGACGAPFFAINAHLRQENDFSGNMQMQTGWAWRGRNGQLLRIGMQYFNGLSDQYQFYNTFEEQIGAGAWYDF